ncbi:hypothetical protein KVR01_007702 [Diaporthe batatas]|uniref:uncharacterized protein n=1 Tax=Diaporthe batatas TaxID=748121 RepID=UPI001D03FA34|nr:uncharacterized protein KVR01_007702 [Diaporthe batatas]KAG8161937.1 hypothetical protein KVR01_007702 [Diaporthe batatas]
MGSVGPSAPIRLAILEADEPLPSVVERLGRFGAIFTSMFEAACKSQDPPQTLGSQLTLTAHDVVSGDSTTAYPDPKEIDAVLVTGSRYSAYDDYDWVLRLTDFIRRLLLTDSHVRVIGVCFGHQIIARALGATVAPSPWGWELSLTEIQLTETGKAVFGTGKLEVYQTHRDMVVEYPPTVMPLAQSRHCPTQAMYIPGRLFTVQGHPEFPQFMMAEMLRAHHQSGIILDGPFDDAMKRALGQHDGIVIAQAFLRFLKD